jgi:hypothetical protein
MKCTGERSSKALVKQAHEPEIFFVMNLPSEHGISVGHKLWLLVLLGMIHGRQKGDHFPQGVQGFVDACTLL